MPIQPGKYEDIKNPPLNQVARAGAGEVQLLEGYFVHFTAPENLTPIPKHVVFVLDTSGSMRHRKMHQTIAAMVTIIIITMIITVSFVIR